MLNYQEAKKLLSTLNIRSKREYHKFVKSDQRPSNIPVCPEKCYKNKGWLGYADYLSTNNISNKDKQFLSYNEAKIICSNLNIKSSIEWFKYLKLVKLENIPYNPVDHYKRSNTWISWSDFLNFEEVGHLFKRLVYVYEFSDNHVYVGLTCDKYDRQLRHTMYGSVYDHIIKTGLTPIFKIVSDNYIEVIEAQRLEANTVILYKNNNWNILNKVKTGGLGFCKISRTDEEIKNVCQKYTVMKDFRNCEPSLYDYLRKRDLKDLYCSHMLRWNKVPYNQEKRARK